MYTTSSPTGAALTAYAVEIDAYAARNSHCCWRLPCASSLSERGTSAMELSRPTLRHSSFTTNHNRTRSATKSRTPGATRNIRHEVGDEYNTKRGSYGFTDAHGIYRRVEYVADGNGFRAIVKTNEPGTKTHHAAHALYHSNAPEHIVHHSQHHKEQLEVPIYVDAAPQHTVILAPVGHGYH
ncbi:hypothetical protein MTO96_048997 [Rhipicephalus appendiculatus]